LLPEGSSRTRVLGVGATIVALVLLLAGLVLLISPGPEHASPNADDISTLYWIALGLGSIIFVLVEGVLLYSIVKFRHRRGGPQPAQIRGNTTLEVGWTLGAATLILILTAVTFVYLGDIIHPAGSKPGAQLAGLRYAALNQGSVPSGDRLTVRVNGQQYLWRYDYDAPGSKQLYSYHDMYVPVGITVVLKITSSDVAHSWWIPELGGKADAIPRHTNETWFRVDKAGEYVGECAELCGDNHADMRARVIALPADEFAAWQERQASDIQKSQGYLSLQRKVRGEN
jgi:cytochrome c oxidase subunit 2